jgi:hypothetical protein
LANPFNYPIFLVTATTFWNRNSNKTPPSTLIPNNSNSWGKGFKPSKKVSPSTMATRALIPKWMRSQSSSDTRGSYWVNRRKCNWPIWPISWRRRWACRGHKAGKCFWQCIKRSMICKGRISRMFRIKISLFSKTSKCYRLNITNKLTC